MSETAWAGPWEAGTAQAWASASGAGSVPPWAAAWAAEWAGTMAPAREPWTEPRMDSHWAHWSGYSREFACVVLKKTRREQSKRQTILCDANRKAAHRGGLSPGKGTDILRHRVAAPRKGNGKQNPGRCLPRTARTLAPSSSCGVRVDVCALRRGGECIMRSYPLVPTIKPTKSTAAALRVFLQQAMTPGHYSDTTSLSHFGTPPFTEHPPCTVANQRPQQNRGGRWNIYYRDWPIRQPARRKFCNLSRLSTRR